MRRTEYCEYVSRYRNQLYMTAYSILKNEMDAEDAACNAILKGYEHLDQLKNSHKFKPWLITITKNEALKIRQKRLELPGNEKVEELLKPAQDNYSELWDVVQNLKEEYRLVVVMFYYNDLSIRDIADVLDIPVGTVKSRLNRGREQLKEVLKGKGEGESYDEIR
ncbi:MAG: sigma-70 family RNA polymerase sigma factor [Lachnospiraceae bacterium]|nr:sigma-70 family RNA polymerase sigma factor [Lachnospiraceae bacterium]